MATHIKSRDGMKSILMFLEHPEVEHRVHAFRLTRILSECFGQDLADELKRFYKLSFFKEKLLDDQSTHGEKSDSACILANIQLSEEEVKTVLEANFIKWIVTNLKNQQHSSNARLSRHVSSMVEGLVGLLLHFTKSLNPPSLTVAREQSLMTVFCEQLSFPSKPRVKQLAALGLKNLSEAGRLLSAAESGKPKPRGVFAALVAMCGRPPPEPSTCPIHNAHCEDDSQLCLLKSNCIRPLVDLLTDEDTSVHIAAVEALSTLIVDNSKKFEKSC